MTAELRVKYEGTAPGLADGRLSLRTFMPALAAMLHAVKSIATNIAMQAARTDRGVRGGRYHRDVQLLDLELRSISHNCLTLDVVAVLPPRPGELNLVTDLPERSVEEFIVSADAEAKGQPRQAVVRNYLEEIPSGVEEHEYSLVVDGSVRITRKIGGLKPRKDVDPLPGLREFLSIITGVMYQNGNPQVRLDEVNAHGKWFEANESLMQMALQNLNKQARALIVDRPASPPRLLRLSLGKDPLSLPSQAERDKRLFGEWAEVLRRLA